MHTPSIWRILLVIAGFGALTASTQFQTQLYGLFGNDHGAQVLFAIGALSAVASSILATVSPSPAKEIQAGAKIVGALPFPQSKSLSPQPPLFTSQKS